MWGLPDVVEANRVRRNDSKAMKKRLAEHQERLNKMKGEVTDWDEGMKKLSLNGDTDE